MKMRTVAVVKVFNNFNNLVFSKYHHGILLTQTLDTLNHSVKPIIWRPLYYWTGNKLFSLKNKILLGSLSPSSKLSHTSRTLSFRYLNFNSRSFALKATNSGPGSSKKVSSQKNGATNPQKTRSPLSSFFNLPNDDHSPKSKEFKNEDWITVYKFPHIKAARVVQKMKIYQTIFTGAFALPLTLGCYLHGVVDGDGLAFVAASCGLACAMLYIMGNFCSKLIGIIYVTDKDPDIVRIAHMTFWGERKDDVFLKTEFIPFSELPDNVQDTYIHIKTYSDPENTMYLTLKYGTVYDAERFEEIFGGSSGLIIRRKQQ